MAFDPVSYLMGKKSGGGGGSSVANALYVTFTPIDATTATADFTAGQIAEIIDNGGYAFMLNGKEPTWFCSHTDYRFTMTSPSLDEERTVIYLTASSADSNTFTMS